MPSKTPQPQNRKSSRAERLSSALRENLKRRKVQQRLRGEAAKADSGAGSETPSGGEGRS